MNLKALSDRCFSFLANTLFLLILLANNAHAAGNNINVLVTDGIDKIPLSNQSVVVYQVLADGSRKGISTVITDSKGELALNLLGLGNGTNYQLRTLPKHGSLAAYSGKIKTTGNFTFNVANVRVKAINGQTDTIIKAHKINTYKRAADGKLTWLASADTDSTGLVDFQLPQLDTNQHYIFKALTLSDGRTWNSNPISNTGAIDFVIGNKLLNVTVLDGIDNTPLTNQSITIYQRLTSDSRSALRTVTTDSNGKLFLDLQGLGSGTNYELKSQLKHGSLATYSGEIKATGNFIFNVANVRVKAINGQTDAIIKTHKITAYKQSTTGKLTWLASADTDSTGLVDFQLPQLDTNQHYIFKALTLSDGRSWNSNPISNTGAIDFVIGNKLLNVTVLDGIDNTPLTNQSITIYQRLTSDSRTALRSVTTDSNGKLFLDLQGLGSGTNYELKSQLKHGSLVTYSGEIKATGNFTFNVANVRVKAINGQTDAIIKTHKITAYKQSTTGKLTWLASATTDASGLVDFELPQLSSSQQYIFQAISLSDGSTWNSKPMNTAGFTNFIIGNKLLNITVKDGVSNTALANQSVVIFQYIDNNDRKGFRSITTDSKGKINIDLPGLGSGTIYELRTLPKHGSLPIYSGKISNTGNFTFNVGNFRVKAVNGQTASPITSYKISAYKVSSSGNQTWFASSNTNSQGLTDFQLPNLAVGQQYIFKAIDPTNGRTLSSEIVNSTGTSTFVIGNKLLNITVNDGVSNTPLANQPVVIFQYIEINDRKGFLTIDTDSNGQINIDLPGLGKGTIYELRTLPKHGSLPIYSGKIDDTGNFTFNVGNFRVKAVNGQTGSAIKAHKINAYKRAESGKLTWLASSLTDSSGFVDFQLPDMTTGQHYIFKALNLSDGRTWSSDAINKPGISTFVIGNKPLKLLLVNALNHNPLPNIKVSAYIRMPDNSLKLEQLETSDSTGRINFNLKGLGSGSKYVFTTSPYGLKISSKEISSTGALTIEAGAIEATLRRKDNNALILGHKLFLYEKIATGGLAFISSLKTDHLGKVYFDPTGLGTGKVYVIKGNNLFGNNQDYYSQWISSKGQLKFIVDPTDPHMLDTMTPTVKLLYPNNNATLSDRGFLLKMQITDNNTIQNVVVSIIDPIKGTSSRQAVLKNNEWRFSVTSDMISKDQTIEALVKAKDQIGNISNASFQFKIINDITNPALTITSHQSGDQIDEQGFLLTGTVFDNTGKVKLLATIIDPVKHTTIINKREIEIGKNHHWALAAKDLPRGQHILVRLQATDSASNITKKQLLFSVMTEGSSMIQLVNRITFGTTPELLLELRKYGADSFIEQQLHPELIDDSEFEDKLTDILSDISGSYLKLHYSQIARATYSKRQLLEVMTQFWESHFNTDLGKVKTVSYEEQENNGFRENALGNFRDLLQISATSPAMLKYLDNRESFKDEPNENYARELMELHSLGVDNVYTSKDIAEVARIFTGWRINNGAFYFDDRVHDNGEKVVFGTVIPSGSGMTGGETVLDLLAEHQATAEFICTKLLQVFVSDSPSTNTINHCATDFLTHIDDNNQIALVLEGIFKSVAFSDSLNFHNKVKTPFEFVVNLYRNLPIAVNYSKTQEYLSEMGMPLFYYPLPTGWPEKSNYWVNSNQLIQRWQATNNTIIYTAEKRENHITDPSDFLINQGIETTEAVLGYLFEILLAHDYSDLEWNQALSILNNNQSEKFDIHAPGTEVKIRSLLALMLQYPTYQLQ